tara:strand:+ start:642 stop:1049 length:408 start_codon:yes stop_codon:yes gene_type:complete
MILDDLDYNNPYSVKTDRSSYARYYYAFTKKLLCHEDCIKYATSQAFRYKITEYKKNRKQRQPKPVDLNKVVYNFDLDYDKDGILKQDKYYIFYKDKVYSKERFKYLNIIKSAKYGDYIRLNSGTYNNYKYVLEK